MHTLYHIGGYYDLSLHLKNELTEDITLCIVPFTSTRKMGSIVVRRPDRSG